MHASVSRKPNHIEGHVDTKELHEIGTRCREVNCWSFHPLQIIIEKFTYAIVADALLVDPLDKCLLISLCNF